MPSVGGGGVYKPPPPERASTRGKRYAAGAPHRESAVRRVDHDPRFLGVVITEAVAANA